MDVRFACNAVDDVKDMITIKVKVPESGITVNAEKNDSLLLFLFTPIDGKRAVPSFEEIEDNAISALIPPMEVTAGEEIEIFVGGTPDEKDHVAEEAYYHKLEKYLKLRGLIA